MKVARGESAKRGPECSAKGEYVSYGLRGWKRHLMYDGMGYHMGR
jgi:hypothetical protein